MRYMSESQMMPNTVTSLFATNNNIILLASCHMVISRMSMRQRPKQLARGQALRKKVQANKIKEHGVQDDFRILDCSMHGNEE